MRALAGRARRAVRVRGGGRPAASDLGAVLERLNPGTLAMATGHRVILNRLLTALELPVPRLHGAVGRAGGWSAAAERPLIGVEEAGRFLAALPGDIALRPYAASLGAAARLYRRDGAALVEGDRRREAPEVAADLYADPACDLFVVQEMVAGGDGPLTVVRLLTLVADDGAARVIHASLAGSAGVVEELDPGSAGGRIAEWDAACALAVRGALLLMPQRALAWDLALASAGPVILGVESRYPRETGSRFGAALAEMERVAAVPL